MAVKIFTVLFTLFANSAAIFTPKHDQELRTALDACFIETNRGDCRRAPYGDTENWDVSLITNMDDLFAHRKFFNADITKWDTGRVTSMSRMFEGATSFNRDITEWDVARVTDMSSMFRGATSFNHDIRDWKVMRVQNFDKMFYDATSFQFCRAASSHTAKEITAKTCFRHFDGIIDHNNKIDNTPIHNNPNNNP